MKPLRDKRSVEIAHYLLGMIYFTLSAAPCMILPAWTEDKVVLSRFGNNTSLLYASLGFLLLILVEYQLIAFLLAVFKGGMSTRSRLARLSSALCLLALGLGIGAYVSYKVFAWQTFVSSGTFMSPDQFVSLVLSVDIGSLWLMVADTEDIVRLALGISLCLCLTACLGFFTPALAGWRDLGVRLAEIAFVAAITFSYYRLAVLPEAASMRDVVRTAMRASISPESSVAAYLLFPGSDRAGYPIARMNLVPRYGLEEWRSRIEPAAERPNVVVLLIEALRADVLGLVLDGKEIMPNLNRLAREGIAFERAFSNSGETAYSQVAVVTGQHPWRSFSRLLGQEESTGHNIYEVMSAAGYQAAQFASEWSSTRRLTESPKHVHNVDLFRVPLAEHKKDLSPSSLSILSQYAKLTFDLYDRLNTDLMKSWISRARKPFFTVGYFFSTHFPYEFDPRMGEPVLVTEGEDPNGSFLSYPAERAEEFWRRYLNKCRIVDDYIGELLEFLSESGYYENTVLIVTGDHGEEFHEHGGVTHGEHLHRVVVGVPLVVWGKPLERFTPRRDAVVDHLRIPPTILEAAGLPEYHGFQACGMLSAAADADVFMTSQAVLYEDGVVSWPWKYARTLNNGEETLFDLENDPGEKENLAKSRPGELSIARKKLEHFQDSQLGYHRNSSRAERQAYFPPRYCVAAEKPSMVFQQPPGSDPR